MPGNRFASHQKWLEASYGARKIHAMKTEPKEAFTMQSVCMYTLVILICVAVLAVNVIGASSMTADEKNTLIYILMMSQQ